MKSDDKFSVVSIFVVLGFMIGICIGSHFTSTKKNVTAKVLEVDKSGIVTVEIAGGTKYRYIGSANVGEWLNITMDTAGTKDDKTDDVVIKINDKEE